LLAKNRCPPFEVTDCDRKMKAEHFPPRCWVRRFGSPKPVLPSRCDTHSHSPAVPASNPHKEKNRRVVQHRAVFQQANLQGLKVVVRMLHHSEQHEYGLDRKTSQQYIFASLKQDCVERLFSHRFV